MKKFLLTILSVVFLGITAFANEVIVGDSTTRSNTLPMATNTSHYFSLSQQIYLASELGGDGTAKELTAISFYYQGTGAIERTIEVWVMETTKTTLGSNFEYKLVSSKAKVGTLVFDGVISIPASLSPYQINFNQNDNKFDWDGTKNLIITVYDKSDAKLSALQRHTIWNSTTNRCLHKQSITSGTPGWDINDLYNISGTSSTYINKAKFTFADAVIPAPTSPTATDITYSSATLGWTAAAGADSYEVRYGTTSGSLGDAVNVGSVTSYDISGLEASTKYYYQIRTKIGDDYSAWTAEANFTTSAHTHDAITFSQWTFGNLLPTSAGNYYLTKDVTLSGDWKPGGSINLCLNGHTVNMGAYYGEIDGITVSIYDCVGTGSITSSNSTQTLLASGSTSKLYIYADIENTGGGRKALANGNAIVEFGNPIAFADNVDNSAAFAEYQDVIINPVINRSFTSASYNTICLPFGATAAQLAEAFGAGYDLQELTNSTYDDEEKELTLEFTARTAITAGKPYLIKPASDATNPSFVDVSITVTEPMTLSTTYINCIGLLAPTVLEVNNHNLLFVYPGNTLVFPNTSNPMNGFRAYFEVKGAARAAVRARIAKKEDQTQAVGNLSSPDAAVHKRIMNGQLVIEKNGILYNAQGLTIKK